VVWDGLPVVADRDLDQVGQGDAVLGGAGDGRDDCRPARVGGQGVRGGLSQAAAQRREPVRAQRIPGGGVPVRGEHGGADVPGDPPPQRRCLVLVGQRTFGCRLTEHGGRVGAGPGQGGEVIGQRGPVRVGAWGEPDLDGQRRPRGAVSSVHGGGDTLVEGSLLAAVGGGLAAGAGGPGVVRVDGVRGPEDRHVGQQ
jgi:hypothetical protein